MVDFGATMTRKGDGVAGQAFAMGSAPMSFPHRCFALLEADLPNVSDESDLRVGRRHEVSADQRTFQRRVDLILVFEITKALVLFH